MITKSQVRDIIDYMNLIKELKNRQNRIKKKLDLLLEKVSLHLVFLIGVGLTSLVAKIFGKSFINKRYYYTSWKKHSPNITHNKMY